MLNKHQRLVFVGEYFTHRTGLARLETEWMDFCFWEVSLTIKQTIMKSRIYRTVIASIFMFITIASNASVTNIVSLTDNKKPVTEMTTAEKETRIKEISARVNEIKAMDKSSLTRVERKALRAELKDMRKEAKAIGGGVYLSVGAIIIIILLLILIL
jgi:hypothetical protein